MQALKSIIFEMPGCIENVEFDMLNKYKTVESRVAYLKLVKTEALNYYKNMNEENDDLSKYNISVINEATENLNEDLESERKANEPLGFRFEELIRVLLIDNAFVFRILKAVRFNVPPNLL